MIVSAAATIIRVGALMRLGTNVSGHKRVWAQICLGTNVSGHKRLWAQTCLGINVCGHSHVCPNVVEPHSIDFGNTFYFEQPQIK